VRQARVIVSCFFYRNRDRFLEGPEALVVTLKENSFLAGPEAFVVTLKELWLNSLQFNNTHTLVSVIGNPNRWLVNLLDAYI